MIEIGNGITLDERELQIRFVRARGPGGQHVNKSSTAVQLMFDVHGSSSIPRSIRKKLIKIAGGSATNEGVIVLFADRYRSQRRNRMDAIERLVDLIRRAATPTRKRIRTRRTSASIIRRLEAKKRQSRRKQERRRASGDE